jgi:hypothetical protein
MVGMFVCLCLASQNSFEREFLVPTRTVLGVKLLRKIERRKQEKYKYFFISADNDLHSIAVSAALLPLLILQHCTFDQLVISLS